MTKPKATDLARLKELLLTQHNRSEKEVEYWMYIPTPTLHNRRGIDFVNSNEVKVAIELVKAAIKNKTFQ